MVKYPAIHLQPFTLTAARVKGATLARHIQYIHTSCATRQFHILVIVKCKSKKFLLFEVEVGGHQVEEFVRQELWLEKEITNQTETKHNSKLTGRQFLQAMDGADSGGSFFFQFTLFPPPLRQRSDSKVNQSLGTGARARIF